MKNRKKRKVAEAIVQPLPALVVKVDDQTENFYKNYVCSNGVKYAKFKKKLVLFVILICISNKISKKMLTYIHFFCSAPFVKVDDMEVSYQEFQESLKKYRDITDTLMSVYCSIFNGKPMKYLFDKSDRKKIALSPSLAV